jgi:hypothetical protein
LSEPAARRKHRQPRAATRQFGNLAARCLVPWHFSDGSATPSCPHATLHPSQAANSFQDPRRLDGSLVSFPPTPLGALLDPPSCEPAARSVPSSVAVFPAPASSPLRQHPLANDRRRRRHRLGVNIGVSPTIAIVRHPRPRASPIAPLSLFSASWRRRHLGLDATTALAETLRGCVHSSCRCDTRPAVASFRRPRHQRTYGTSTALSLAPARRRARPQSQHP